MLKRVLATAALVALLTGCAGFPGGGVTTDTFSLSNEPAVPAVPSARNRQLLVVEPIALKLLDSEQVVIRTSESAVQYLADSQWNDRLPRLVQAKLIEAFENTGEVGGVGRSGEGLAIDFQVVPTIRTFEVVSYQGVANIELSVKIINDRNGVVVAQRVFTGSAALNGTENEAYVRALDNAFTGVVAEIVPWVMGTI
ncbi:ABC-type transport auxiliary lipoprotein family protein [Pararhizobium haloflavum]|uniref:ABC-type transport auxiliary lipoprotein family protein n=1 Tax=Pararhizobium haloflavum TaxID=2037914 RepID=UPI000C19D38D|nr:ABC-type transport auxiliary lipoprotein family protein [Pararhizobium haloflavum]